MFFKKKKVTVKIQGGLGNQLFQIAAVFHYAEKFGIVPVFKFLKKIHERKGDVGGYTYWDVFNTTNLLNVEEVDLNKYKIVNELSFSYTPFKRKLKNVCLFGYYQSPKYVNLVKEKMKAILWSNKEITTKVNTIYQKIIKKFNTKILISIHIRRGDYLKKNTIHTNLLFDYYVASIKKFPKDTPIIVFSNDQKWCEENLKKHINNPLYFISEMDVVEMLLMSKIKNNIIANSSFSWWGAYINQHVDKKIIAPKEWFGPDWKGPDGQLDWSDIYCENWELI